MRQIRQKLHSRRGASLLFALLLFLVASMVSITILNAALTAAKRLKDDRAQEQEYLTLSSAARLVAKSLSESSVVITETRVTVDGTFESYQIDYAGNGDLAGVLSEGVKRLCGNYIEYDGSNAFLGNILNGTGRSLSLAPTESPFEQTLHVQPLEDGAVLKSVYADPLELYLTKELITGSEPVKFPLEAVFKVTDGTQQVYLSAWVPTIYNQPPVSVTTTYITVDEEGNPFEHIIVTTTKTTTLTWTAELSTNPPNSEVAT